MKKNYYLEHYNQTCDQKGDKLEYQILILFHHNTYTTFNRGGSGGIMWDHSAELKIS